MPDPTINYSYLLIHVMPFIAVCVSFSSLSLEALHAALSGVAQLGHESREHLSAHPH